MAKKVARQEQPSRWLPLLRRDLPASAGPLAYFDLAARLGLETVSRSWRAQLLSPSLWRELAIPRRVANQLDNASLIKLNVKTSASLLTFDVANCNFLTDHLIDIVIAAHGHSLTKLKLNCCDRLSDAVAKSVAKWCRSLTWFEAPDDTTDESIMAIAASCPSLTALNLESNILTDISITAVAANCPSLKALSLFGCTRHMVTDASCRDLASGCPALCVLDLTNILVSDDTIKALVARSGASLRNLGLACCPSFSHEGIKAIVSGCPALLALDISSCNLEEVSIVTVAKGLPSLTELIFNGDRDITDASLNAIAAGLPSLTLLELGGCPCEITNASIMAVARGCPALTYLNVSGMSRLTDDSMRAIVAGCALLTTLRADRTKMTEECEEELEKILALRRRRKPVHPELAPPFDSSPPSWEVSIREFL